MSKSRRIYRDKCGCAIDKATGKLDWICKEHYTNLLNWDKEPQHHSFVNIKTWKRKKRKGYCCVRHCIEPRLYHEMANYFSDVCKKHYWQLKENDEN